MDKQEYINSLVSQGLSDEEILNKVNEKFKTSSPDFQTPTAPGAVVEEIAAPDMDSSLDPGSSELNAYSDLGIGDGIDNTSIKEIKQNTKKQNKKPIVPKEAGLWQTAKNTFSRIAKNFTVDANARKGAEGAADANAQLERVSKSDKDEFLVGGRYSEKEGYTIGATRMNKKDAIEYYKNEKKYQEERFVENLVKSDVWQKNLNQWESITAFDEDGNFDLKASEAGKLVVEQMPQMLVSAFSGGYSTYAQETANVWTGLMDKEAAKEGGMTEEDYNKLNSSDKAKYQLELIQTGKADKLIEKAEKVGMQNASIDLVSNFFVIGKGLKFLPKKTFRELLKFQVTKETVKLVGAGAASQAGEVITENLQELNSAWALGDEYNWNTFKETSVQTLFGAGGTQVTIGGTNYARKEIIAEYVAAGDPNATRSIIKAAKEKIKLNKNLNNKDRLQSLAELDAAEEVLNNKKFRKVEGKNRKELFDFTLNKINASNNVSALEQQLNSEKELHEDGWTDLSTEAKLAKERKKVETAADNINAAFAFNSYTSKGKGLSTWVNNQVDGFFKNKSVTIKETAEDLKKYLEINDPKALKQKNVQKLLNGEASGVKFGDNAYIVNENVKNSIFASKGLSTATNVAHHEILHFVLDGVENKGDIKTKIENEFKNSEDPQIKQLYDVLQKRLAPYEKSSEKVQIEEFFTGISDVFRGYELNSVEGATVWDSIGEIFSGGFNRTINNIRTNMDASNALGFIKKYNDFNGKQSLVDKITDAGSTIVDAAPKGKADVDGEALASIQKLTPEIQESVAKEIGDLKIAKEESLELNKKFGKEGVKTNKEQAIERRITESIKPTVDSFAESRTKALYDPIAKDAKENVTREQFRESMKSDINTMVFNEYNPSKQTVEKFITTRGFLRANDLASRLGIKSVEQGIDKKIDDKVTGTVLDEGPTQKGVVDIKKTKPSRVFSKEQYNNAVDAVVNESKNLDFEKLSFKKLGNITAKTTGEISGVPAKKFLNPASNLTKDEIINGRMFITKNVADTFRTLPQGAVLESDQASEKLLGTSTGIPKGILNSPLYVKQPRGKKGAGLSPYKLNPNATTQTLLDLIGKPGDPVSSRSPEAQNVKSIIKLIDKNITNEIFREKVQLSPQVRADIAAGKSEALASTDVDLQVAKEELYETYASQEGKAMDSAAIETLRSMKFKVGNFDVEYAKATKGKSVPQGFKGVAIEWYYKTTLNEAFKNDPNVKVNMDIPLMGNSGVDLVIMVGGKPLNIEIKSSYKDQMGSVSYNGPITELIGSKKSDKDLAKKLQLVAADSRKLQKYANRYEELTGKKMDLTYPIKVNKDIDNIIRKEEGGFSLNTMTLTENLVSMTSHYNSKGVNYIIFHDLDTMLAMGKDPLNLNIPLIDNLPGQIAAGPRSTGTNKTTNERNFVNRVIFNIDSSKKNIKAIKDLAAKGFKMSKPEKFVQALKEQGALASVDLNLEFNNILENSTKIESRKRYARAKAEVAGKGKGKFDLIGIPPSAQDFMGLVYKFIGKGKEGDAQLKWIKTHLTDLFAKGMVDVSNARVALANDYKEIKKISNIAPKDLKKKIPGEPFTVGQAVRVAAWTKQNMEVPGLSKVDLKELNKYIEKNPELKTFVDQLIQITKENGYPKPDNNWLAGTISTDLLNGLNTTSRKQALERWQTNADIIFSEENLNKLEAAYGKNYRVALENILGRMKSGTNRKIKGDSLTNRFTDWINGSVGTIMFFNMRSAVLQTISSVNFVNWSDNNILKAASAFANQPQYWKDVVKLMNSDYLIERRNGLKINVNEADIAEIAAESNNKAKAFINKLLKLGFLPTQIADSFAISSGGATFYRNRIKSLVKDGMSQKDAEAQAFLDFREIAEESQQSSRPDRISKQQASEIGRIVLAFANTPSQYARIMQKAGSDLVNRRGDDKTNISKIIYYGAIQNVIFNALQQALFAIAFDEEPEDEKMNDKTIGIANGMMDSLLRGIGFHGAVISTIKNGIMKIADGKPMQDAAIEALSISPPVSSKIKKLKSAGRTFDWNKKEIKEKGLSLDNPAFLAIGQITSATMNIPLDRAIKKATNIKDALDKENDDWKRVANALGWAKWELEWKQNKRKNKKVVKYNTNINRSSIDRSSSIRIKRD